MDKKKIIYKINAINVFNDHLKYLYDLGNTGRIVKHKIIGTAIFDNLVMFKVEDRGTFSFKRNESFDITKTIYSDPRELPKDLENILNEDLEKINNHLQYYEKRRNEITQRLNDKRIIENNTDIMEEFVSGVIENYKNKQS